MEEQTGIQIQQFQTIETGERSSPEAPDSSVAQPDARSFASPVFANEYTELKRLVKQKGLLEKQPIYYTYKILYTIGLLAMSLVFLFVINNFWLQLLNAVYLGFALTQVSLIGHDIGHHAVFRTSRMTTTGGLLITNFLLGWSWSWWLDRHNQHHGRPNQLDLDPDIDMPFLAFTQKEALSKQGFPRFMVKYQAYLFFPLLLLVAFSGLLWSIQFLFQKKAKNLWVEGLLMAAHHLLYFSLLFTQLSIWHAIVFFLVNYSLRGVYFGTIFAPNHKGMLILDKDTPLDFLRQQVLTARNVKGSPFTDFWYGGLNYQIEHHLFPTMPRNRLQEAERIVKVFCEQHAIAHHETRMFQSYQEILHCLHDASAPLLAEKI